jgi:diguanylate cyclase (GGDEF)-like protein
MAASKKRSTLYRKLALSHIQVAVISILLVELLLVLLYWGYTKTNYPAVWAGEDAAYTADEISYSLDGDPLTFETAVELLHSLGLVPYFEDSTKFEIIAESADWAVIFDADWNVLASNNHDYFPIGQTMSREELPGFSDHRSNAGSVPYFDDPAMDLPMEYIAIGSYHFGLAPILDRDFEPIGYYYIRYIDIANLFSSDQTLLMFFGIFFLSTFIVIVVSSLVSTQIASRYTTRIEKLTTASSAIAKGKFNERLHFDSEDEVGKLAEQFNQMAEQLEEKMTELENEIEIRRNAERQLEMIATTDVLTGLFNRRYFFELAEISFEALSQTNSNCSLLMMDIDHFKAINDHYGHSSGDQVLKELGTYFLNNARNTDIIARYGGEEFIMLMPNTDTHAAKLVAERYRYEINKLKIALNGSLITPSISIGITNANWEKQMTLEQLIHQADQALYSAKKHGRNQCVIWEEDME